MAKKIRPPTKAISFRTSVEMHSLLTDVAELKGGDMTSVLNEILQDVRTSLREWRRFRRKEMADEIAGSSNIDVRFQPLLREVMDNLVNYYQDEESNSVVRRTLQQLAHAFYMEQAKHLGAKPPDLFNKLAVPLGEVDFLRSRQDSSRDDQGAPDEQQAPRPE